MELEILKQKVEKLENFIESLQAFSKIPLSVDQAFRARFLTVPVIKASSKGNDSEDQAVNEGGAATYNVLKEPDDFLEVQLVAGGTIYYIPVYTALT